LHPALLLLHLTLVGNLLQCDSVGISASLPASGMENFACVIVSVGAGRY